MLRRSLFGLLPLPFIKTKEYSDNFNEFWQELEKGLMEIKDKSNFSYLFDKKWYNFTKELCTTFYLHCGKKTSDERWPAYQYVVSICKDYYLSDDEIKEIINRIEKFKKG